MTAAAPGNQRKLLKLFEEPIPAKTKSCLDCQKPLGFMDRWLLGRQYLCKQCHQKRKERAEAALNKYASTLAKKLEDGELSPEEQEELKRLKKELSLSDQGESVAAALAFQILYSAAVSDRQVTENEVKQINELLAHYEIQEDRIEKSLKQMARLHFLTMLEEGILPEIQTGIFLKKNETAHLEMPAELYEERTRREYVGGHTGFSFRVAKGVYWRVGGFKGWPVERKELVKVDRGTIVVTNKRIVFRGEAKTLSIPFRKLIGLEVFKDAVKLDREGKKRKEFFMVDEPRILAKVINLAVNQE